MATRTCVRCSAPRHELERCATCDAGAIALGPEFWARADVQLTLRDRNWSQLLTKLQEATRASQARLAEAAGVSQALISRIITGQVTDPSVSTILAVLGALGASTLPIGTDVESGSGWPSALPRAVVPASARGSEHNRLTESPIPLFGLGPIDSAGADLIDGLSGILSAYVEADARLGPLLILNSVQAQIATVERLCRTSRGIDRAVALSFVTEYLEFYGWLLQDAGDFVCAMRWTSRALDYALELADPRVTAYILMRKANIATESGDPRHGLGLTEAALASGGTLTPRLRAVILRQRLNAHALLRADDQEFNSAMEAALDAVADSLGQQDEDRAAYCTPAYISMEVGASLLRRGRPQEAIPILQAHADRSPDRVQTRDHILGLARLATAYAAAGDPNRACIIAEDVVSLAATIRSWRVHTQLNTLAGNLTRWGQEPTINTLIQRIRATPPTAPTSQGSPHDHPFADDHHHR